MIHKLEHVGIMVKDMDASIRFYTEILNLELVGREKLDNGVELSFLSYPDTDHIQVELVGRGSDDIPAAGKVDHLAFTVSNIEAEVERLRGLGVKLIDEKPKTILGGVQIAFFYGPDGERLEFFQPKQA
ncbi:VOC family protein [Paenibacillus aurantius]|uniref:VOC family protein n=1 Tax=Paenibacillus aurantius TaxID=2918900 RepID=A0AA96LE82_9BACL|nr:VOC family protein [Paenibacillus aurantius]WJH37074.1 VOC family protein [Paenibacillus sp. CC-CFT747]WNQ12429.1 VOC family protein [Paenibacillus aurantius]